MPEEFSRRFGARVASAVDWRLANARRRFDALRWLSAHADLARQELEIQAQVAPVTAWIEQMRVAGPQITVIMPTRNRLDLLKGAVASVQSQVWNDWQLVIIDDGSSDGTAQWLRALDDARVQVLRLPGVGSAAARNAGLAEASGEVIAYLDDDNVMAALWLKAVAWAFAQYPDIDMLYGARIVETDDLIPTSRRTPLPQLVHHAWDRGRLLRGNYIDLGTVAHRRLLSAARFDPGLGPSDDYDLVLRLTADRAPLVLPVIASLYRTSAPDRLSLTPGASHEYSSVLARHAKGRG